MKLRRGLAIINPCRQRAEHQVIVPGWKRRRKLFPKIRGTSLQLRSHGTLRWNALQHHVRNQFTLGIPVGKPAIDDLCRHFTARRIVAIKTFLLFRATDSHRLPLGGKLFAAARQRQPIHRGIYHRDRQKRQIVGQQIIGFAPDSVSKGGRLEGLNTIKRLSDSRQMKTVIRKWLRFGIRRKAGQQIDRMSTQNPRIDILRRKVGEKKRRLSVVR